MARKTFSKSCYLVSMMIIRKRNGARGRRYFKIPAGSNQRPGDGSAHCDRCAYFMDVIKTYSHFTDNKIQTISTQLLLRHR